MHIDILDLQESVKIKKKDIIKHAKAALEEVEEDDVELSIVFVEDEYIRNLN